MIKLEKISAYIYIFLGIFFVFSALSKGLDIFSVSTKIQDYSTIFKIVLPKEFYEIVSIFLVGSELTIGFFLITGFIKRFVYFCTLSFLTFFLILTFYTAVSGKLEDCGCFGSVMSTSPWISFVKNIILLILLILSYPHTLHKTSIRYSYIITCIFLTLLLCCSSVFNQPLMDASKYSIGHTLHINTENQTSIDVDFVPNQEFEISTFGIIHNINEQSVNELLDALSKTNTKPVIITSIVPKDVNSDLYEHAIVGFIDNSVLRNIISTDFGIISLDDNGSIINKWQKDFFNLQFYNQYRPFARTIYILSWITISIWSIYILFISIKRECRKTHPKSRRNLKQPQ